MSMKELVIDRNAADGWVLITDPCACITELDGGPPYFFLLESDDDDDAIAKIRGGKYARLLLRAPEILDALGGLYACLEDVICSDHDWGQGEPHSEAESAACPVCKARRLLAELL